MPVATLREMLDSVPFDMTNRVGGEIFHPLSHRFWSWVTAAHDIVPGWWSEKRDVELRKFWKQSDHLAGAIYQMAAKMVAIPFRIVPKDTTVKAHAQTAQDIANSLRYNSGVGEGWETTYRKWVLDLLTQDNGAFMLIMGAGPADGPIQGMPQGVMHLDSARCTRTGYKDYPVLYHHDDGKRYKLHYTRVMFRSQMESPNVDMNGVGFCAVSRIIQTAQHLMDIARYEQERFGSRPLNALLVGSGISGEQIYRAFAVAEAQMDQEGLQRYGRTVAIGSQDAIDINRIDMNVAPESYDKEVSMSLAMFTIALALGVDARELWPASASGATKADALVQHLKARGKGPGQIIGAVEGMFNQKYLSRDYEIVFDYIDDEQDRAQAEIRELRAKQREKDLDAGTLNIRTARLQMLRAKDITESDFIELELGDGRLEDGSDVLLLFAAKDANIKELLNIGVSNPLRIDEHVSQLDTVIDRLTEKIEEANVLVYNANNSAEKLRGKQALAALTKLKTLYEKRGAVEEVAAGEYNPTDEDAEEPLDNTPPPPQLQKPPGRTVPAPQTDEPARPAMRAPPARAPATKSNGNGNGHAPSVTLAVAVETKQVAAYREALTKAATDLWTGALPSPMFSVQVTSLVQDNFTKAWEAGMREAGVDPAGMTTTERSLLQQEITTEQGRINGLANYIRNNQETGGSFGGVEARVQMWVNTLERVEDLAKLHASNDPMLRWDYDPNKENCTDCLRLNGHVHRASEWRAAGIEPKDRRLECSGYHCGCRMNVTDASPSRDPIPRIG